MADPRLKAVEPPVESDRKENQHGATSNASETESSQHNASIEADDRRPLGREQDVLPRGHTFREWAHSIKAARLNQSDGDPTRSTVSAKSSLSSTAPITAPPSTNLPQDLMTSGYYVSRSLHSPSSWKSLRLPNSSGQSSSGSLHTLAEHEGQEGDAYKPIQRAASTRVPKSPNSGRRHSKSASMSQPVAGLASQPLASLRSQAADEPHPGFPNQALAALSPDPTSSTRPQPQRSRSSYLIQSLLHNDIVNANRAQRERLAFPHVLRTADNSPVGSPGLFSPTAYLPSNTPEIDLQRAGSPQLHHLQVPKETHAAEIDHDMMTGNKMINSYEVIKELGRGEHGKVKLGRDNANELYVAIKIVPRYSKYRRLGRLGEPQDQTKREVAILKKARHPNVVSLIEVIDDPSKNKVYLILEYVERGEIKWRKTGVREIAKINNTRFESECKGVSLTLEPSDHDRWLVRNAALRHDALEQQRQRQPHYSSVRHYEWDEGNDLERTLSHAPSASHSTHHSESYSAGRGHSDDDYYGLHSTHSLAGSMYGPYLDDFSYKPERKQSIAPSHMSSEYEFDREDPELSYVPALTQEEARRAFRDTLLGLEFLHAIGIIHRDIKPSNLLVASDYTVKISDFGVSYFGQPITDEEAEAKGRVTEKDAKPLDDERELARSVGTPAFWGPELCYEDPSVFPDGKAPKVTGAIDLWALGVTLYTMIYARLPFYATNELGLHAAVCTTDPVLPKTRLVPVDTTADEHVTHTSYSINSNKRLDFELKFEAVPDSLQDLIRKLLTRDPARRITIAQAKQHPWVLENIEDATQFLEPPKVVVQGGERRITEPDEKEIKEAVVKRSFLGEVARVTTRAFGTLFKGPSSGRKRGVSTGTNTAASTSSESVNSPAGSTTSTVGKYERGREARRTSLPPDELLNAIHRSRENTGHPLAQSQTASPDNEELKNYFIANTPKQAYSPQASPGVKPTTHDTRPKLPDRGLSSLSTADSVKTIRASQFNAHHSTLEVPREHESPHTFDAALRAKMENLWEGTTRTFTRLASRDRRHGDASRSPSVSRASSESELRTMPSVAISHNQASGTLETPEALRHIDQTSDHEPFSENLTDSSTTVGENCRQAPTSSPSAFLQAQEINQRRHILEAQQEAGLSALTSEAAETTSPCECPLSPDDLRHLRHPTHQSQAVPSPPQEADMLNGEHAISTTVSSIEDFTNSSVTQSTSNPSFVATSGASSPPEEEAFLSNEYKAHYQIDPAAVTAPDFMRTEDTVVEHTRPRASIATGKSLQQQVDDHNNEGDDEGSSDEDEMVMMAPKKN